MIEKEIKYWIVFKNQPKQVRSYNIFYNISGYNYYDINIL